MAVVQRGENIAIARILYRQSDVIADKRRLADDPFGCAAVQREQTLPRRYETPIAHVVFYPPDSA
jgi:hypothetical protein